MIRKDKDLLLRDLSARLPYGVFCNIGLDHPLPLQRLLVDKLDGILLDFYEDGKDYQVYLGEVKPYLRSMSNITKEEYEELRKIDRYYGIAPLNEIDDWEPGYKSIDWLLRHHFDFRGLIPNNLAIKAPKGMYKK